MEQVAEVLLLTVLRSVGQTEVLELAGQMTVLQGAEPVLEVAGQVTP